MNKLISTLVITVLLLTTAIIIATKPPLHKQVMVVSSEFTFIEEQAEQQSVPQTPIVVQPAKVEVKQQVVEQKQTVTTPQQVKPKVQSQPKQQTAKVVQQQKSEPKVVKQSTVSSQQKVVKQVAETKAPATPVVKPKEQSPVVKETVPTTPKQLTEQEEIIVWNQWRSNLQNRVMSDTKISAPVGTVFKFSFTVDKFRNISNIKVWSTNDAYTNLAVNLIKPVLQSYQGKQILEFPQGTKRVITNVTGNFVIAHTMGYSSASDYSDYEKVKK